MTEAEQIEHLQALLRNRDAYIETIEKELEAANQHLKVVNNIDVARVNAMDIVGHSAYPLTDKPRLGDADQNISRQVVIDLDGNHKHFAIAWYDFDDDMWISPQDDLSMLDEKHAKWLDILPLD